MPGHLALYLTVLVLGAWASLRLTVVGFCALSLVVAALIGFMTFEDFPSRISLSQAFLLWSLLHISYVMSGILLPITTFFRRGPPKAKKRGFNHSRRSG